MSDCWRQAKSTPPHLWEEMDWDFHGENTGYLTHGLHKYPGRMPPQIPRTLLELFPNVSHVLDPFCGSGTTLVEAILAGKQATGIDINPIAVLISKVKTTPLSPAKLKLAEKEALISIAERVHGVRTGLEKYPPGFNPNEVNLYYWFSRKVADELGAISDFLLNKFDSDKYGEEILNLFLLCFSNTVRTVSFQRPYEFKLYRVENLKKKQVDVLNTFKEEVSRARDCVLQLTKAITKGSCASVIRDDFIRFEAKIEPVDMVITSPPYGDSKTTLAYGQFSRYPLLWLGYDKEDAYGIDERCLGGGQGRPSNSPPSQTLSMILHKIRKRNKKRADAVERFFSDLFVGLCKIFDILNVDAPACFVVGDRTVKGIRIPTHIILVELGLEIGFTHFVTTERNISSKVLPRRNNKVDTICKEKLVVLLK